MRTSVIDLDYSKKKADCVLSHYLHMSPRFWLALKRSEVYIGNKPDHESSSRDLPADHRSLSVRTTKEPSQLCDFRRRTRVCRRLEDVEPAVRIAIIADSIDVRLA